MQVLSLVGELRSHIPCSTVKKKKKGKAFLCFWTKPGLILLIPMTLDRRTLARDPLGRVGYKSTNLTLSLLFKSSQGIPSALGINSKFLSLEFKLLLCQQQPLLLLCSWRELYSAIQSPLLMLFPPLRRLSLSNCLSVLSSKAIPSRAWLSFAHWSYLLVESLGLCVISTGPQLPSWGPWWSSASSTVWLSPLTLSCLVCKMGIINVKM